MLLNTNTADAQRSSDSAMYAFVNHLISQMTIDEKIGQLNLLTSDMAVTGPSMRKQYIEDIKAGRCGGIFNAYGPAYVRHLQSLAVDSTRLHIPLLFGFDVIHGHKTIFPIPLAMACSWDTSAIAHAARIAATEASADGLNWVFSPMVDIARDPRWGRVAEGAGEDPYLGSLIARAFVRGYQSNNLADSQTVMACVKHFALYGAVEAGREYNIVDMSRRRMFEDYLPPYHAAIEAGAGSVMSAFNEINGIPATANHWLLTNLLRHKWHFKGFVVTDYNAIPELINHGIAADTFQASKLAFQAGAEMDMQGLAYIHTLKQLVEQGQISMDALDRAVRDVLIAKYRLGLFEDPYNRINEDRAQREIMSPDKLRFAREMARESIVLLKNENYLLPLKKTGTIAVIGPLANDQRDMIGCWSGAGDWHKAVSILEGIREAVGNRAKILYALGANITDDTAMLRRLNAYGADIHPSSQTPQQLIQEAVATARKADVVVLCLGESEAMSGEAASRADIHIPENQRELMKALYATGKPIVLVLSNGRPLVLTWENAHIPAILETWFLGTEAGHAIADVLFGDYNPSGKLTMSFPYAVGQIPVYYNHKNTGRPAMPGVKWTSKYLDIPNDPLYPFGYGLSYTHFRYSSIRLDRQEIMPGDVLHVRVDVTNDGDRDGIEIVQLYIHDRVADVTQPVKQLKAFQRIYLKKGETRTVEFSLTAKDLQIYDRHMHLGAEPGVFDVYVGGNSRDVQSASFTLQ
ncbi:MAG: beta-glucosidase BglX [Thermoflavifilum sp.]|nr:beta-glucosidase BglX [Thermoflavifilum sp.]